jgi:hypothetical protein
MSASSKPTPIAIPNELHEMIEKASQLAGLSKQDTMRLAMRIGLADLKRCNYDIAGAIVDRAQASKEEDIGLVAEKGTPYKAPKKARCAIATGHAARTQFFSVQRNVAVSKPD